MAAAEQPRAGAAREPRPEWDEYFMNLAREVARRSNCQRRHVGAIAVKNRTIISTGYNGTPFGVTNCDEGGCPRCAGDTPPGEGYDTCLCVHAEQNAIALAARHGTSTEGAVIYSTLRPCFGCVKEMVQSGIGEVVYEEDIGYDAELEPVYSALVQEAGLRIRQHS
ncbi:MAG: dCMP deaminase family protein [Chloroflexota bacterium]|jgi:dCMP deaminase|nr:dCMP deaminase family protein [Chloroflexota bacterium]MDP6757596.1 dCMP deaminase family protein [Chloroflexota bacterium]